MVINALNSGAKTFMADFEGESPEAQWAVAGTRKLADYQTRTLLLGPTWFSAS